MSSFRLVQGDALADLHSLGDESVDVMLTDPPYCSGGISEAGRKSAKAQGMDHAVRSGRFAWFVGDNMGTAGLAYLLREVGREALRVLMPGSSILVFQDWRQVPNVVPAIESAGLRYSGMVVWDKGAMGLGRGFRVRHELVLHFTKGKGAYHSKSVPNVILCPRPHSSKRSHPTEKPVPLLSKLLDVTCPPGPGRVVVDPFAGSGATGEAALLRGADFYGIERDPAYIAKARRRLLGAGGVEV